MPHVYFVVPDLGHTAAAKQVSLVAPAFVEPGWSSEVYSLAGDGPFSGAIRAGSVSVMHSTANDFRNWSLLRFIIPAFGKGLVHAFGLKVLRRLWAATVGMRRPPVILTLTGRERFRWFDRRCLRIVSRVLVPHQQAAAALILQGIPGGRISIVPSAVGAAAPPPDRAAILRLLGIPTDAPLIVTAGHMSDWHRLLRAVWTFEFIRYLHADAHMLVIGDGPGRAGLEFAARGMAPEGSRVHFLGERPDVPAILALADVVIVPHPYGGANVALESMSAGRAVVAANTPDLSAVIHDGETGRLYSPSDSAAAAGMVRKLLLDPAERQRLGEAAQCCVNQRHQIEMVVRMLETIHGEEFTSTRSSLWAE
jgi:glycosyltransferase involved in cell wall biosynthesis